MSRQKLSNADTIVRAVTVIMGAVVGLTFLFGFGNVLNLALRLGVSPWVAPLVAPAVDLNVAEPVSSGFFDKSPVLRTS